MGFSDLLALTDVAVRGRLGESLTYTPGVGSPVTVTGVFDAAYVVADGGAGLTGVSSSSPAAFFTLADLPSDPSDDLSARVTRGSTVYTCHEAKPDGLGGVLMLLHKAA